MKYKPVIWLFMTSRMKKGLKEIWPDTGTLLKKAKPIYKDLLKKVEGVSDQNPMSSNITMSFVIIAIWLASDRKITPAQMSRVMETALDWKPIKVYFGTIDMNTEKGIKRFGNMMKKKDEKAIADFCRKYGYEEINPVLCNIDYTTLGMMHSRLIREHTVAEGAGICDYWTVGNKVKNPK